MRGAVKLPFFIAILLATIRLFGYLWRWNKHILSMEDILKFLLVAGVIIIGFVKQAKKEAKNTSAPSKEDDDVFQPNIPHPLPENWEGIPVQPLQPTNTAQKSDKKHRQTAKPFIPRNYQTKQTGLHNEPAPQTSLTQKTEDAPPAVNIQSAEEIRKGIIWSEILQRKY